MNVDLGIWGKLTKAVMFLLLLAGVAGVAVWYLPLIKQNERMRREILRLEEEKQKQEQLSKELKTSIDALRYDVKALERLARERLGYAKPDEKVIVGEMTTNQFLLR
ncbi:MAG: FtsB family cell division protein [Verrucomicrobiota bacterium]